MLFLILSKLPAGIYIQIIKSTNSKTVQVKDGSIKTKTIENLAAVAQIENAAAPKSMKSLQLQPMCQTIGRSNLRICG